MVSILIFIFGLALCVQAFVGLTFLMSSIQENEKRATFMGGLQFMGMLVLVILFFILNGFEFFDSGAGFWIMVVLLIISVLGFLLFFSRIGVNQKALQGTRGFIVGKVKRWDERNVQFSKMMRILYAMTQMGPPQLDAPQSEASSGGDKLDFSGPKDGAPPDVVEMAMALTDDQMNAAASGL